LRIIEDTEFGMPESVQSRIKFRKPILDRFFVEGKDENRFSTKKAVS
jgi:hypothetical protein